MSGCGNTETRKLSVMITINSNSRPFNILEDSLCCGFLYPFHFIANGGAAVGPLLLADEGDICFAILQPSQPVCT